MELDTLNDKLNLFALKRIDIYNHMGFTKFKIKLDEFIINSYLYLRKFL